MSEAFRKGVMKMCVFQGFRGLGGEMGNREEKKPVFQLHNSKCHGCPYRRSETQQLKLSRNRQFDDSN